MLRGLSQKGTRERFRVCPLTLTQTGPPPAQKQNLPYPGTHAERGNPVVLLPRKANRKEGRENGGHRKMEKAKAIL